MEPEKHIVFKNISLPDLFTKLNNIDKIQELWDGFHNLYKVLKKNNVSSNEAKKFDDDSKQWVENFVDIYQSKNFTPYLHIFSQHACKFLQVYKNINQFTQQGMEKLNDQTTLDFAKSTNHNYHKML